MHPLIADSGEVTVLRNLAAFAYGRWSVEWPDSVPEEQRPVLPDEREFGFAARLGREPGRMGRAFVRADATIQAADPEVGEGTSDVEALLDDATERTTGDVFFEREITRAGLGSLVPRVDFRVGDIVPVEIWGRVIDVVVASIEDVVEAGAVVDWRVHVGGSLVRDDAARLRANLELERAIAQERRERVRAVAGEAAARRAEIGRLSGQMTKELTEQSKRIAEAASSTDEATRKVVQFWSPENQNVFNQSAQLTLSALSAYSDVNQIKWVDQDAWNAQQEKINAAQEAINKAQKELDAEQDTRAAAIANQAATIERRTPVIVSFSTGTTSIPGYGSVYVRSNKLTFSSSRQWRGTLAVQINVKAANSYSWSNAWDVYPGRTEYAASVGTFEDMESGLLFILPL